MSRIANGVGLPNGNYGKNKSTPSSTTRCPRRVVLLTDGEQSEVAQVLLEMQGEDISGKGLHAAVQNLAGAHPGACVAAEWLGALGWVRFLWCHK